MKTKFIIAALALASMSSCKKNYTCECFNPSGVDKTYTIYGTLQEAQTKCNEYSMQYQTVPMSESGCVLR